MECLANSEHQIAGQRDMRDGEQLRDPYSRRLVIAAIVIYG
jgi:hypothetical protein